MAKVVLPALVAGLGGGVAGAFAGGPLGALTGFGVAFTSTLVMGGVNQALYKEPKTDFPSSIASGGQNITTRSAAAPRRIVYGQTRVGGAIFYVESIGKNKLLNLMIAYAGHQIDSFQGHYFGQEFIDADSLDLSDTRLIGTKYTNLRINVEQGGWTAGRITRGRVGDAPASETSSLNYVNAFGHQQLTFNISGTNLGNDGHYRRVITRADDIRENGMRVERLAPNSPLAYEVNVPVTLQVQHIWIIERQGAVGQAPSGLETLSSKWLPGYKVEGIAYSWYRLGWNAALYPHGLENITAIVKGKKVYDPRSGITAWSNNNALILADYLTDSDYGMEFDYTTEIEESKLIAAANICDESVSLAGGGTEKRYTCNGSFLTTQRPQEIINAILGSMFGRMSWIGGKWHIYAGAYVTPTIEINEDDLRGEIRTQPRISKRNLYNAVKGTFIDPGENYEPMDFRFQTSDTFTAEDGGEILWRDAEYPFTQSATMAQRIARMELLYARQQIEVFLQCKFTVMELVPGDTVQVTLDRYGWALKVFEVLEVTFQISASEPGIDLSLKEIDSTIYDWNTSLEQTVDPAPDTTLPSPWIVTTPSGVVVDEVLRRQKDGSVLSVLRISWDQGGDLTGVEWIVEYRIYKKYADDATDQFSSIRSEFTVADIAPVVDGEIYEIRVVAVNSIGSRSNYSDFVRYTVVGKSEPPNDVDALEVYELPNGVRRAVIRYKSVVPDLAAFELRHKLGQSGGWDDMVSVSRITAAGLSDTSVVSEFFRPVNAGDYRFAVKAVDTTGNYSTNAVIVDVTFTGVPDVLYEFDFKGLGWPGTKTNCHVDAKTGDLAPDTLNTWGTSGLSWESAGSWDSNRVTSYIYEHLEIDIGSDQTLTPSLVFAHDATSVTVEEKHKTAAGSYTSYAAISGDITFRYIMIRISVTA